MSELRVVRERRNISLKQVADDTRISLRHLKSLEDGNLADLPGGMYNRAFLRTYCEYLGLDPDKFLRQYQSAFHSSNPPSSSAAMHLGSKLLVHISPILLWSLIVLSSSACIYLSRDWVAEVLAPYFRSPVQIDFIADRVSAGSPGSLSLIAADGSRTAPVTELSMSGLSSPGTALRAAAATEVLSIGSPGDPGQSLRLDFQVVDKCWVSADSDGSRVLVKVLEPGEALSLDADERLYVILGNAGGIRARINGIPMKSLGTTGQVVRFLINEQNWEDYLESHGM